MRQTCCELANGREPVHPLQLIEAVLQLPCDTKHDLPFVITVEPTSEQAVREAVEKMSHLDFLREPPLALPMEPSL